MRQHLHFRAPAFMLSSLLCWSLVLACQSEAPVYRPAQDPGPAPGSAKAATTPPRPAPPGQPAQAEARSKTLTPPAARPSPQSTAQPGGGQAAAASSYLSRCAVCHGATGQADGQMSRMLNPKPRSFADPGWQASVTDDQLRKIILGGGAAVGRSPSMPASPDLEAKPALLEGLVKHLRSFRKDS